MSHIKQKKRGPLNFRIKLGGTRKPVKKNVKTAHA